MAFCRFHWTGKNIPLTDAETSSAVGFITCFCTHRHTPSSSGYLLNSVVMETAKMPTAGEVRVFRRERGCIGKSSEGHRREKD